MERVASEPREQHVTGQLDKRSWCPACRDRLDAFFEITERNSSISTELFAGLAGFLCNVHLLVMVPYMMDSVGHDGTLIGFVLVTVLATTVNSFVTNIPLILGPGIGGAAYLMGTVSQEPELGTNVVYTVGLALLILVLLQLPERLYSALPDCVKASVPTGIGFYLSIIGCMEAHMVVSDPHAGVKLGDYRDPVFGLACLGLGLMLALELIDHNYVEGRLGFLVLVLPIMTVSVLGWATGTSPPPAGVVIQELEASASFVDFGRLNGSWAINSVQLLIIVIFDVGGLFGATMAISGLEGKTGRFGFNTVFFICGLTTLLAGGINSGPVIIFGESIAAVLAGARTGLATTVSAGCMLLALFFAPLLTAVPIYATAPPLISVGWHLLPLLIIGVSQGSLDLQSSVDMTCIFFTSIGMVYFHGIDKGILAGLAAYFFLTAVDWSCSGLATLLSEKAPRKSDAAGAATTEDPLAAIDVGGSTQNEAAPSIRPSFFNTSGSRKSRTRRRITARAGSIVVDVGKGLPYAGPSALLVRLGSTDPVSWSSSAELATTNARAQAESAVLSASLDMSRSGAPGAPDSSEEVQPANAMRPAEKQPVTLLETGSQQPKWVVDSRQLTSSL